MRYDPGVDEYQDDMDDRRDSGDDVRVDVCVVCVRRMADRHGAALRGQPTNGLPRATCTIIVGVGATFVGAHRAPKMRNIMRHHDRSSAPGPMSLTDSDDLEQPPKINFLVIFIVGPSGIGKSAVLRKFMANAGARFKPVSLDEIAAEEGRARGLIQDQNAFILLKKVGTEALFLIGITSLFRRLGAASDGEIYLVDVGAGFQNVAMLARLSFLYPVIGIIASEEAAFERFCKYRSADRSFDRHKSIEYSQVRRKIYASATHPIDTTNLSLDEAVIRFGKVVRGIANRQPMIDNQGSNSKG
jgi:dephospho-CoA kinase